MRTPADLLTLLARWRARAAELEAYAPPAATAFRTAAQELAAALAQIETEPLTLERAAAESGYAAETLRRKVAAGELPNVGRKHAPRIPRGALPHKGGAAAGSGAFNPDQFALRVVGARRGRPVDG